MICVSVCFMTNRQFFRRVHRQGQGRRSCHQEHGCGRVRIRREESVCGGRWIICGVQSVEPLPLQARCFDDGWSRQHPHQARNKASLPWSCFRNYRLSLLRSRWTRKYLIQSFSTITHEISCTFIYSLFQEGLVYAVEFSHRSGRDLLNVAKKRPNIIPIVEDARHPHKYRMLVGE